MVVFLCHGCRALTSPAPPRIEVRLREALVRPLMELPQGCLTARLYLPGKVEAGNGWIWTLCTRYLYAEGKAIRHESLFGMGRVSKSWSLNSWEQAFPSMIIIKAWLFKNPES
jgi:hypothetical protein